MAESGLKRFWKAIKPPSPVPRRPSGQSPLRSKGLWEALKPPPAVGPVESERSPEERRRRKMLVVVTAALILVGGGAWGVYSGVSSYIASAPARAQAAFQDGMRLMSPGKYQQAVERFTNATTIWPPLTSAYLERGLAHLNLHEMDLAAADLEQAIKLDPNLPEAHTALGNLYRERGDLNRAVNEFTLAINLASTVDAYDQRGHLYESLGEHQKALEDYNRAISELPEFPHLYRARAVTRQNLGDEAGAKEDRQKADLLEHSAAPNPAR
jgi:tetratricopeptide (TPR) repeat protein